MARARKKTVEPVVVTPGVEVAEVIVPVTVQTEAAAPKKRAPRKPRKPASPRTPAPAPPPRDDTAEPLRRIEEAARRIESFGQQVEEARRLIDQLRQDREEAGRELQAFRREAADAIKGHAEAGAGLKAASEKAAEAARHFGESGRKLLHDLKEDLAPFRKELQALKPHLEAVPKRADEAAEAARLFRETGQELLHALKEQLTPFRKELREARPHLEAVPKQAAEVADQLAGVSRALPEAGRQLNALQAEAESARSRLEDLRQQVTAAELRLAVVEQQAREGETRLDNARALLAQGEADAEESAATRNRLGLTVGNGVVVAEVEAGEPAEAAGVLSGDILRAVNGAPVYSGPEVRTLVEGAVGEGVALLVVRAGQAIERIAMLNPVTAEDAEAGRNRLGLVVGPGVVVDEVQEGSPAEAAGLRGGDVINAVNGSPVLSGEQLRQAVQFVADVEDITLQIGRAGEALEVQVSFEEAVPA